MWRAWNKKEFFYFFCKDFVVYLFYQSVLSCDTTRLAPVKASLFMWRLFSHRSSLNTSLHKVIVEWCFTSNQILGAMKILLSCWSMTEVLNYITIDVNFKFFYIWLQPYLISFSSCSHTHISWKNIWKSMFEVWTIYSGR